MFATALALPAALPARRVLRRTLSDGTVVSAAPSRDAGGPHAAVQAAANEPNASEALASNELLRGRKAIEIQHNGSIYRLQATRLGKLILTK